MYFDDSEEFEGFSGGEYPSECEKCGSELETDTNSEGDYYVTDVVCTNDECDYKFEYSRVHKDEVEEDYYEFITVKEDDEEKDI